MVFLVGVGCAGFAVVALGFSTIGSAAAVFFSGSLLVSAAVAAVVSAVVVISEVSVVVFAVVVVVSTVVVVASVLDKGVVAEAGAAVLRLTAASGKSKYQHGKHSCDHTSFPDLIFIGFHMSFLPSCISYKSIIVSTLIVPVLNFFVKSAIADFVNLE